VNPLLKLLPPPTRDTLAKHATDHLVSTGIDRANIRYEPENFRLLIETGQTINLENLYAFYVRAWPWQRRSIVATFLTSLNPLMDRAKTIDAARGSLMPAVRDAFLFEALRLQTLLDGKQGLETPRRPLGSRLCACIVLDSPTSTSPVTASDLETWRVSFEETYRLALENLEKRSVRAQFQQVAEGVYVSPWSDCFDTARILLDRAFAELPIEGDPVVTCPNWNRLFVGGAAKLESVAGVISAGMHVMQEEPRPMSGLPLVRRGGEWVDFDLPHGHVAEKLLRKSRVLEMASIYSAQEGLLEKVHEKNGTDVYIAAFNGTRKQDTDEYGSYCVWSKDCVTLLPRTERVSFFVAEPEKKIVAEIDFDLVVQHCDGLLKATEYTPTRYLVDGFPSEAQMETMRHAQARRPRD
jgi:hypothetical protein